MSDILELNESTLVSRSRAAAYWELTKPRISAMVLVATALGFYLALPANAGGAAVGLFFHTLLGTAMIGFGANALNQYLEASYDARMVRTRDRPLPSGRLTEGEALAFGAGLAVAGTLYLAMTVNGLTAMLGALALVSYAFVYTPLKRLTSMCVFVGAVPGALPPLMGWAAAAGEITTPAWMLFTILYFWQLPHFAAIAWLYRKDYARAGYPMLPVIDPDGTRTTLHFVTHTVALVTASLLPAFHKLAGPVYAMGAIAMGLAFMVVGAVFLIKRTQATARVCVLASVAYLPLLFAVMMLDKVPVG